MNTYEDIVCNCDRRVVDALDMAIDTSNMKLLRSILHEFKDSLTITNYQTGLIRAAQNNNLEIATELLNFEVSGHLPREKVVADAFNICMKLAHLDIANVIMDIHSPGWMFYDKRLALKTATEYGQLESIKLLLKRTDLKANYSNNYIIREAAKRGFLDIVKYISNQPEVNIHDLEYEAYYAALANNRTEVVEYLCKFPVTDSKMMPINRRMVKLSTVLTSKPYLLMAKNK